MTPEPRGMINGDGTNLYPIDLPDPRNLGVHRIRAANP